MAKETKEPIYITKNGEGDLVLMSIDAFEKREQMLKIREKVLQAEQERLQGAETLSVSQARERLNGEKNFFEKSNTDSIRIVHAACDGGVCWSESFDGGKRRDGFC